MKLAMSRLLFFQTLALLGSILICAGLSFPETALGAQKANREASRSTESARMREAPPRPPAKEGEVVTTKYFSVKLPKGWIMPYPVNNKPDGTSAVFADEKTQVTVTVNVISVPLNAMDFSSKILPNMEKSGLNTSKPVKVNGLYKVTIRGKASGEAWFGSNGKLCTATVILSQSPAVAPANELLSALKTSLGPLFPHNLK